MPTTECEIKLRLHNQAQALAIQQHPLLQHIICQRQELRSIYLDTVDARLQQKGMALRLRHKNNCWLQTLKTKGTMVGGLFARHELETPISTAKPDFTVLASDVYGRFIARKKIRKHLQALFETIFTRQCWQVQYAGAYIEVALDTGLVSCGKNTTPLLELELELVSPAHTGIAALYGLARTLCADIDVRMEYDSKAAKGYALRFTLPKPRPNKTKMLALTSDISVEDAFTHVLHYCLQQMQFNAHAIMTNNNPEGVHQLRVALRRMRTCLHFFARIIPRRSSKELENKSRFLLAILGINRDADTFYLDSISPLLSTMATLQPLADYMMQQRYTALQNTRNALDSAQYAHFMLYFGQWLAAKSWRVNCKSKSLAQPLCNFVPKRLQRCQHRVQAYSNKLYTMSDEVLHALRIDVKKLRYANEFFVGNAMKNSNKALADLQTVLGIMNDHYVGQQTLAKILLQAQQAQDVELCQSICSLQDWIIAYRPHLLQQIDCKWKNMLAMLRTRTVL